MVPDITKEERMDALARRARDILSQSGNCAQTSFAVLKEGFDLDDGGILKALTPFPGIALRGETCGAVVGCLMAIGLVFGREDLEDWKGYISSLPPARRFCRRFEEEHGSTNCDSILDAKLGRRFNLANSNESAAYIAAGGKQKCGEVIASAVQIAAELIMRKK